MRTIVHRCPSCSSPRVYRSRVRSVAERVRALVMRQRPYRCHECQYRGWADELWEAGPSTRTAPERGVLPRPADSSTNSVTKTGKTKRVSAALLSKPQRPTPTSR